MISASAVFASVTGNPYRLTIYDSQARQYYLPPLADDPITIDTNNTDNPFAPSRSTTGTLRLISAGDSVIRDSDMVRLSPASSPPTPSVNISQAIPSPEHQLQTYVRLATADNTLLWHGFLSAESYSQPFTARAHETEYSLNGLLQALDSVYLTFASIEQKTIAQILVDIFQAAQNAFTPSGQWLFTNIYLPYTINILPKVLNTAIFYQQQEHTNEGSVYYERVSLSALQIIETVCTFFGLCVTEYNGDLCFSYVGEKIGWKKYTITRHSTPGTTSYRIYDRIPDTYTFISLDTLNLHTLPYRGDNHQQTTLLGARSVEVVANLNREEFSLPIPGCPDLTAATFTGSRGYTTYFTFYISVKRAATDAFSNITHSFYLASIQARAIQTAHSGLYRWADVRTNNAPDPSTLNAILPLLLLNAENQSSQITGLTNAFDQIHADINFNYSTSLDRYNATYNAPVGSFYCQYATLNAFSNADPSSLTFRNYHKALYLALAPYPWEYRNTDPDNNQHAVECIDSVFAASSLLPMPAANGFLRLTGSFSFVINTAADNIKQSNSHLSLQAVICFALRIGDKYFNGTSWGDTRQYFYVQLKDGSIATSGTAEQHNDNGWYIPVNDTLTGTVTLEIGTHFYYPDNQYIETGLFTPEFLFDSLSLDFVNPDTDKTSRTANRFYRNLDTNFADRITVNTDIASLLGDDDTPVNILHQPDPDAAIIEGHPVPIVPATVCEYVTGHTDGPRPIPDPTEWRRPESDLLNRMADTYSQPRRSLSLQVRYTPLINLMPTPDHYLASVNYHKDTADLIINS